MDREDGISADPSLIGNGDEGENKKRTRVQCRLFNVGDRRELIQKNKTFSKQPEDKVSS